MDDQIIESLKKFFSVIAFFGLIFFILTLGGCKSTTGDIVKLRGKERELKILDKELRDNLQVSIYGMNVNPNPKVRESFLRGALLIAGTPSVEEMKFGSSANLAESDKLIEESKSFLKKKRNLSREVKLMRIDHDESFDDTNWLPWIGGLVAVVIGAFLAIRNVIPF